MCCCLLLLARQQAGSSKPAVFTAVASARLAWPAGRRAPRVPRVGCGCADVCLLLFMVYRRVFPC